MSINDKIKKEINDNQAWDDKFKELLTGILNVEENTYRYKKDYELLVMEYLKKENKSNDKN